MPSVSIRKVDILPSTPAPDTIYAVEDGDNAEMWITTSDGVLKRMTNAAAVAQIIEDSRYTHTQMIPAATWTITHNLGFHPHVTVVDSSGREVEGDTQYLTPDVVVVSFSSPFAGKAYL